MALTAGALSQVSVTDVGAVLLSAAAVSGTTPYTYQWYRSTLSAGFVPGGGFSISGATSTSLTDTGLTPGTIYYYKVVATDSNATPAVATASALTVTTSQQQASQNQFAQAPWLGQLDMKLSYGSIDAQYDPAATGSALAGQALVWGTGASVVPLVYPSTAQADVVAGFISFNIKDKYYSAGEMLGMSQGGNVIYLLATAAIQRGGKLVSKPAAVAGGCNGGVAPVTGSSGFPIIGYALDTAVSSGGLIRVFLQCPSGRLDS